MDKVEIIILVAGEEHVLERVAEGVFDHEINEGRCVEFLNDPRHHLVVAVSDGVVVGFVSAVHYVHPDKRAELWINEVAVGPTHQKLGIGKKMLGAMLEVGKGLGCGEAWVLTDRLNGPAMKLYATMGGVEFPRDSVMFTFKLDSRE
ncbi:MAG TPA: GNAT family N-acetyltransferase [Tepidisphaeraceae bacterium]|nr:GNAT family N-acetyltransferase [Tepidisphaeraceae bacterium]